MWLSFCLLYFIYSTKTDEEIIKNYLSMCGFAKVENNLSHVNSHEDLSQVKISKTYKDFCFHFLLGKQLIVQYLVAFSGYLI